MKVVATYTVKGGVGKTTGAVNLAWSASQQHRTLVWDLDPQGAASYLLGAKPRAKGDAHAVVRGKRSLGDLVRHTSTDGLDAVPSHDTFRDLDLELDATGRPERRLGKLLDDVAKRYEVVVLDCPPGASLLSDSVLDAADLVVVPLVPSPLSVRAMSQVADRVAAMKRRRSPNVLGYLSMVDRRKRLHRDMVESLLRDVDAVVPVVVPAASVVERMAVERAPLALFAPRSPAAAAFDDLWAHVAAALHL